MRWLFAWLMGLYDKALWGGSIGGEGCWAVLIWAVVEMNEEYVNVDNGDRNGCGDDDDHRDEGLAPG